ncbi:MAG TPA: DUF4149 domain-containing protein, partial [Nitrospiria bacterium]|nr:DUF4149 domain-containing protein [Nitrospiria bacterium]
SSCLWFEFLGLGIWIGGMLTIGALVAPTIFNHIDSIELAGKTMSLIFGKFNGGLVYVCMFMTALGFGGKAFLMPRKGWSRRFEGGLIILMILTSLYIGSILSPKLQELREIRASERDNLVVKEQFEKGHKFSVTLFNVNLFAGLVVVFLASREAVSMRDGKP